MSERQVWLTAANGVTALRFLLTLPVVWAMLSGSRWLAVILFLVAAATDGIDGHLARSRGEISALGKLLDPIADKALGLAVLATLTGTGVLPQWMFWTLVVKEASLVLGGMALLAAGKMVPAARRLGKSATVVLFAGIAVLMAGYELGVYLTGTGVALSLAAGVDYAVEAWRAIASRS